MREPTPSRRRLLRSAGGVAALVGTGGLAGCTGLLASGLPTRSETDILQHAPERTVAVADLDATALLGDDQLRAAVDANLDLASRAIDDVPASTAAALDRLQARVGLDPRGLSRALAFVVVPPESDREPTGGFDPLANTDRGVLCWSDWAPSAVRNALESAAGEVTVDSYRGFQRFTLTRGETTVAVGVLPSGRYVLGGPAGVTAALDVESGAATAAGGPLAAALAASRPGPVRIGVAPTRSADRTSGFGDPVALLAGKIDAAYGGLYRTGDRRGLELLLAAGGRYDAEDVYESVQSVLALARSGQILPTFQPVLSQATATRDGTTVEITYEADVDSFATTLLSVAVAGIVAV